MQDLGAILVSPGAPAAAAYQTLRMHGQGAPLGYPSVSCLSSLGVNVKRWRNPASLQRVKCPCPSCRIVKTRSSVSPAGSCLNPRRQVLIQILTPAIAGGTGVVAAVHLAASRLMLKAFFSCAASHTRSALTQDFNPTETLHHLTPPTGNRCHPAQHQ
jgi:hypothetical protein